MRAQKSRERGRSQRGIAASATSEFSTIASADEDEDAYEEQM